MPGQGQFRLRGIQPADPHHAPTPGTGGFAPGRYRSQMAYHPCPPSVKHTDGVLQTHSHQLVFPILAQDPYTSMISSSFFFSS